jgi:hypothetical protein
MITSSYRQRSMPHPYCHFCVCTKPFSRAVTSSLRRLFPLTPCSRHLLQLVPEHRNIFLNSYHTSTYTIKYRLLNGIKRMDWPPYSSDLNPIENVWAMFKYRYRRSFWNRQRIQRSIALAQEVWGPYLGIKFTSI